MPRATAAFGVFAFLAAASVFAGDLRNPDLTAVTDASSAALSADQLTEHIKSKIIDDLAEFDRNRSRNKYAFLILTGVTLLAGFGTALLLALDMGKSENRKIEGYPGGAATCRHYDWASCINVQYFSKMAERC